MKKIVCKIYNFNISSFVCFIVYIIYECTDMNNLKIHIVFYQLRCVPRLELDTVWCKGFSYRHVASTRKNIVPNMQVRFRVKIAFLVLALFTFKMILSINYQHLVVIISCISKYNKGYFITLIQNYLDIAKFSIFRLY
jgi:hypothetical protein